MKTLLSRNLVIPASLLIVVACMTVQSQSQRPPIPTKVVVHAVANDAKLIGTHVGGAKITIRDDSTGKILAEGIQKGETGSTKKIMEEPHARGAELFDTGGAAAFEATLALTRPTVVTVTAEGPLEPASATVSASKTLLLVPGQDVTGDGIVLVIHGLRVEILEPEGEDVGRVGDAIPVRARLTMTCGCPIEPGGLWDANEMTVKARLVRKDQVISEVLMRYAGEKSTFEGTVRPRESGTWDLQVLGFDPKHANFGLAHTTIRVR
ncbi:MAG: hypothetical protein WBX15_20850 [Thermoanaerobaculia bacterium]